MKQQYVLLRKENDLLNSLIGQSFNQKTKFEAYKILTEIHSKAQDRSIGKMALCYVLDKNEIKGIGGSTLLKDKKGKIISNLILDQMGVILATVMGVRPTGILKSFPRDNTNTVRTLSIYEASSATWTAKTTMGTSVQVGSGSTSPARTDFNIETAFGTAPENALFTGGSNPVYNSGLGNFKSLGAIIAGGSGTINESILSNQFFDGAFALIRNITLFRDIISPAVSFIAGQSIALEYTIQL